MKMMKMTHTINRPDTHGNNSNHGNPRTIL